MSMKFRVVRDEVIHEFEFDRECVTFGRGPSNDVVLEEHGVARRHGMFERQADGRLLWRCAGPAAFHRAGAEVERSEPEDPRQWEVASGDVVKLEGATTAIEIEVLTAVDTPVVRPVFIEFSPTDFDATHVLVRLAQRIATEATPAAVLEAFETLLEQRGVKDTRATLVVLSGADQYHNDAWAFSERGCGLAADPTSLFGAAAPEISQRWRTEHCLAILGESALVPIGEGALDALLMCEKPGLSPEDARVVAGLALALRPFAQLFVNRLHAKRQRGALIEENRYFRARQRQHYLFKELVTESRAMRDVHSRLSGLRDDGRPVLFAGEAGTGKELLARLMHHESQRADQMIMRVNCAEFADERANIELFGSAGEDGAAGPRKGVFELVRQGTVLLEEIDLLPPQVQAKLCRLLKENEVRRVGDSVGRPVGARLIATVHRDVSESVAEGRLRRDLYLLLRDQTILVPALRDRREDILPLARKFLVVYGARYGRHVDGFTPDAEKRMLDHFWPGNVRELQARVEASVLGTNGPRVGIAQLGLQG